MHPNSALDQDSRLRKAIRSMGLKIARICSDVKTIQGVQLVDVFDGDSGSDYKDVPILRPTGDLVNFPEGRQDLSESEVLKNGTSVLLGFLEGSRAPVVLGVVNSGASGVFKTTRSASTKTGDKSVDNSLPIPFDGDAVYGSQRKASTIIIRAEDGDISLFVFDVSLEEINNAKSSAERNQILADAIARSPNFDIFLYGMDSAVRILKLTDPNKLPDDFERVLNARYWAVYKNVIEYPYIASLAARIQNIEDLLDGVGTVFQAFKKMFENPTAIPAEAPALVTAIQTLLDLLLGTKKPEVVRNQLAFGIDDKLGIPSAKFFREEGSGGATDKFLPLLVYEILGEILQIHTQSIFTGTDLNRPMGFGGSNQISQLFPDGFPDSPGMKKIFKDALGEVKINAGGAPTKIKDAPGGPEALDAAIDALNLDVPLSDTAPGSEGPNKWESLMSPLIKLSVHLPEE